ncbi:MAG: glycosyltransferase [Microscillaceae bacterium]|nr:glycosyltransferase [Microscillaceae bacterium]
MNLAPICLFTFKRLDTTIETVEALKKNIYASESELFVFTDAPRPHKEGEADTVEKVKEYLSTITGFKKIHLNPRSNNLGCAKSIITGVTEVMDQFGKAIVVEDDIVTSTNFLAFMNQCLDKYENNQKIWSISGYTYAIKYPKNYPYDVYMVQRGSPWGWASWKDRWDGVDWKAPDFLEFMKDRKQVKAFHEGGSDLSRMVYRNLFGDIDGWDPIWIYQQFKNKQHTIYPVVSKVQNIGFTQEATHTKFYNRFKTVLDQSGKTEFNMPDDPQFEEMIVKSYKDKYSLKRRLTGRLKFYLGIP